MEDIKRVLQEQIKRIQLAIRLLVLVIFLGYIMIWIMMPTNVFWLHWLPDIHTKADSTYFGQQGANILIYTFPILFIATLGCLYLHLEKYKDDAEQRKDTHFTSWRQPVLTKGPLGIVSQTELSFSLMFVGLLVWSFSAYVHGMFKNITRQSASKMGETVWEVRLETVGLLLGLVGNVCLAFLFFPVARGSSILRLVGLTSESSIKYHIWLGHTALTLFTAHGLCFVIFWVSKHQISEMLKWDRAGISNVAGGIALLAGIAMWITSMSPIRRKLFELFFQTHHLYLVFVVFFVFHLDFSYSCIMLPGFYLFLIDRLLRFLQSQQRVRLIYARVLPCQAIELNFTKDPGLTYNPTSVIFVNIKSISKLQWHPFTVTSNNKMDPDKLSIVVKSEGNWSQKLYHILSTPTPTEHLEVSVEGPYSPAASNTFTRHEALVMVSGGSGITPFISIIRELVYTSNMNQKTPRILLVAVFKKPADLSMLDVIIPFSGTSHDTSRLQLQIQAYITRDRNLSTDSQKLARSICFKQSDLEQAITSVLGSNSWLWLGAIISSSFIILLLLVAMVHQYYIYPIDHNTNMIYPHAARSIISIVFLCVSLVIPATLAVLWNKKYFLRNARQVQTTETPCTASPSTESWSYQVERELESVPQQSFKDVTTVNYGKRPNLKKIISEYQESNVAVLVSGPKKMRQDVAAICSSGPAKNLHFESFSFNW